MMMMDSNIYIYIINLNHTEPFIEISISKTTIVLGLEMDTLWMEWMKQYKCH